MEDIREECGNYGKVQNLLIPRPPHLLAGKIYMEYGSVQEAAAAKQALSGRKFAERVIMVSFLPEEQWPRNA